MQLINSISVLAVALSTCVQAAPSHLEKREAVITKRDVSQAPTTKAGYRVRTWWENFTHKDGIRHNWTYCNGTRYNANTPDNWGTGEIQWYTQHTDNIAIKDGILTIQPMQRTIREAGNRLVWTSGRIQTHKSWGAAAGGKMIIEASIKFGSASGAQAHGIWPAFWALSEDFRQAGYLGWPQLGEWDIAESIMGQRLQYGLLHCDVAPGGACDEPTGKGTSWAMPRGTWIKVGFEVDRTSNDWRQQKISWYFNDVVRLTVTGAQINKQSAWTQLAHKPYFLLANVAVGGAWADYLGGNFPGAGNPTSATLQNRFNNFEIDWVAVFHT